MPAVPTVKDEDVPAATANLAGERRLDVHNLQVCEMMQFD
jgi:hypothetical protein